MVWKCNMASARKGDSMAKVKRTFTVDEEAYEAASAILKEMGLSVSSGVNVFLRQVAVEGGMPFVPSTRSRIEYASVELNAGVGGDGGM